MNLYEAIKNNLKENEEFEFSEITKFFLTTLKEKLSTLDLIIKYPNSFISQFNVIVLKNNKTFDEIFCRDADVSDTGYIFYASVITKETLSLEEHITKEQILDFVEDIKKAYENILNTDSARGRIYDILNILKDISNENLERAQEITSKYLNHLEVGDPLIYEYADFIGANLSDKEILELYNNLKPFEN